MSDTDDIKKIWKEFDRLKSFDVPLSGRVILVEIDAPGAPVANKVIIFAEDDGAGKTRLMAQFATGAAQQIAIEP